MTADYIPPAAIVRLRLQQDQTLKQFAAELGVSASAVSAWERGMAEPRRLTRVKLATLLERAHEIDNG